MANLPPVNLGVIIFLSFFVVWASRKPLERLVVLSASPTSQPKRQLIMDLCLSLIAGLLAAIFNVIAFDFPIGSGIKLIIGCTVAGFFLSKSSLTSSKAEGFAALEKDGEKGGIKNPSVP